MGRDNAPAFALAQRVQSGHRALATWYVSLAQQLEAGLPLSAAFQATRGTGLPARALSVLAAAAERGAAPADIWSLAAPWLPARDRSVLTAAADMGQVPPTLRRLSERHAELAAAKLRVVLACLYPLFLLHIVLFALPVLRMIDWERGFAWDAWRYARTVALTVIPVWLALASLVILSRLRPAALFPVLSILPFVGRHVRARARADLAFALAQLVEAGVRIDRAWALAATLTVSPALAAAARRLAPVIERGEAPGPHLARERAFPPDFAALYRQGETTGQLDAALFRIDRLQREEAHRALRTATLVYPGLLFFGLAVVVIVTVVRFYAGYLQMIERLAT